METVISFICGFGRSVLVKEKIEDFEEERNTKDKLNIYQGFLKYYIVCRI